MSAAGSVGDLPPEADARLGDLLERWAAPRRLSPAQADAIRARILGSPDELGYEWWRVLLAQVIGAVVGIQGRTTGVEFGLSTATRGAWASGVGVAGPPGTYRPYLRLA